MLLPASPPLTLRLRPPARPEARWSALFPQHALLFARCRFALFEGLRALARARGVRRLWMPSCLCCCVLEAVEAAGLEPALYDVGHRLQPRLDTIAPARGDGLLVVHYFGLLAPLEAVVAFCREHDLPLVEDCAHTLPDPGSPARAGRHATLAVFSLRKQAPVPGGGVLLVNDPALRAAVAPPPRAGLGDARTMGRLALMVAERTAAALACNALRLKDRLPVIDVPHDASERRALASSEYGALPRPSVLVPAMLRRLDWAAIIAAWRDAYVSLATALDGMPGIALPCPEPPPGSVPQMLPLQVHAPAAVTRFLRRRGIEAMRWPGTEQFALEQDRFPGTGRWLAHGLCLPLGSSMTPRRVARVVEAVRDVVAP
jgi:dTDP-4-amino-4,6-dideoxygalactose transaminase